MAVLKTIDSQGRVSAITSLGERFATLERLAALYDVEWFELACDMLRTHRRVGDGAGRSYWYESEGSK